MKKSVFIKFAALIFAFLTFSVYDKPEEKQIKSAKAEESGAYYRIITADAPFYADKSDETPLFYLPYTYYVRVIESGAQYTRVEYGDDGYTLDGYVPSEKLFYDGLTVAAPFPQTEVFTANTAVLYKDAALTVSVQYLFEARELYMYGGFLSPQNERIYYVCYNNRLGYVKEQDLTPFAIQNHPNRLTFLDPETDGEETAPRTDKEEQASPTMRIAVIAVLALAGFFALFFSLGKKPKNSAAAGYYDENDYE